MNLLINIKELDLGIFRMKAEKVQVFIAFFLLIISNLELECY